MEEPLFARLQSEVEQRLVDCGSFEQEIVLLDRGAASALRWVLFGVEHSAATAAATTASAASNAGAHVASSLPTASQRQTKFRNFFGRCFDVEQWEEVVAARRYSSDARVTVVVSDFLWNYEKLLSDIARRLQSTHEPGEGVEDVASGDASRVTLRVLSCLTEQAHNCHPQTAVLGSLDFLQFQVQLQQISNSARSTAAPSSSATPAPPAESHRSAQSTVIVRVEHFSLPCLPVLAELSLSSAAASLQSSVGSSSTPQTLNSYAPLDVVLSSWPGVVDTCPVLLSHVERFDHPESCEVLPSASGVASHLNLHASHGNSKSTSSSAAATSGTNDRRKVAAELPTSTLKSLSLVAHNIASMARTFKLKVDDDHIWAQGGSASLIARKVRELLHSDTQLDPYSDARDSQLDEDSTSLTSAIAAAAREAENRPVPATLLVVDQRVLPASASDNEPGGLLDGLQSSLAGTLRAMPAGDCNAAPNVMEGTVEVEFHRGGADAGNTPELLHVPPPLFTRVSESTEELGFWKSSLLNQAPEHRASLLRHTFLRSPKQLVARAISLLETELGSVDDADQLTSEDAGDTTDDTRPAAAAAERAPLRLVARLQDLVKIVRSKHADCSLRGSVLFAAHVLNLWHELDGGQPRWAELALGDEEILPESLIEESWWAARIPDPDACTTTPFEVVQSSLLEVFACLASIRPTSAQLEQIFGCEGFQSFSLALENMLMKDPVAASRIAETLRGWRDEFSRTGNAGDAFSQAEDARSSGDAQDDLGGEDRRRVIFRFFLHRAFWRMAKAHDAVAHQSRVNSSHQSNHGASEVDSSGGLPADQRIGSDSSVADAIRVALSASTGSELENAGQGGRPESDARWTKVSPAGAYSLEGIRAAGVSAISGFFGWGKTKEKPKAKSPLPTDRSVVFVFIVGGLSGLDVAAMHRALALHNKTHAGIGSENVGHPATSGAGQVRMLVGSNAVCSPSRTYHNIFEYSAADAIS